MFANPVFTVFTTVANAKAQMLTPLSYRNQDVRSVFTRYIKHQFSQLTDVKRHKRNIRQGLEKIQDSLTEKSR